MSFVSHSARTVTTVNDDNDDYYGNSDSTAITTAEANNNNDNTITNGPASMAAVVLRLARSENNGECRSSRKYDPKSIVFREKYIS